jgi:ATP-dependent Clp protease ATP-binding subunit ClpA
MFERFTEAAIKTVLVAPKEATDSGHNYVSAQQLLLGLAGSEKEPAFQALSETGMTIAAIREELDELQQVKHNQ